jgi:hypothetical protein
MNTLIANKELIIPKSGLFEATGIMVYKTHHYDAFRPLVGNRDKDNAHIRRLMLAFEKAYLISPIIVNEKMEIIDGQHRYDAAKTSGLPVYFILIEGYSLKEVQLLNTNSSNWDKKDYLESFSEIGKENYQIMKKFKEDFPEFGISVHIMLLTNTTSAHKGSNKQKTIEGHKINIKAFENGDLVIPDINKSYENANLILSTKPFYSGYKRAFYVAALMSLFKHPKYDHNIMLKKLNLQPTALKHCANVNQYKELLEDIYNFKSREKISFKYN